MSGWIFFFSKRIKCKNIYFLDIFWAYVHLVVYKRERYCCLRYRAVLGDGMSWSYLVSTLASAGISTARYINVFKKSRHRHVFHILLVEWAVCWRRVVWRNSVFPWSMSEYHHPDCYHNFISSSSTSAEKRATSGAVHQTKVIWGDGVTVKPTAAKTLHTKTAGSDEGSWWGKGGWR